MRSGNQAEHLQEVNLGKARFAVGSLFDGHDHLCAKKLLETEKDYIAADANTASGDQFAGLSRALSALLPKERTAKYDVRISPENLHEIGNGAATIAAPLSKLKSGQPALKSGTFWPSPRCTQIIEAIQTPRIHHKIGLSL